MDPKTINALKIAVAVLIGICVVIFLGANKIASSIVLTVTAIVILLPIGEKSKWLKWSRITFVLVAFAFVLSNISTTEYPPMYYHTGFKFFDQILYIFDVFLKTVFGTS